MTSHNPAINELHRAYVEASGFEVPLNPHSERLWFTASSVWGITPDDVRLVVKLRIKLNSVPGSGQWSLLINRMIGDDSDLDVFTNQLAIAKAQIRKKVYTPAKQEVLKATHRQTEPKQPEARSLNDVLKQMREAAQ